MCPTPSCPPPSRVTKCRRCPLCLVSLARSEAIIDVWLTVFIAPTIITTSPTITDISNGSKSASAVSPPSQSRRSPTPPDCQIDAIGVAFSSASLSQQAPSTTRSPDPSAAALARNSESSRSDRSSSDAGPHSPNSPANSPTNSPSSSSGAGSAAAAFFRLPRLKRSRHSLFPLPVKIPPPDAAPAPKHGASGSIESNGSSQLRNRVNPDLPDHGPHHKRQGSTPLSSPNRSSFIPTPTAGNSPTRGSPTRGSPGRASPLPTLLRKDSIRSAHSARSTASQRPSDALRRGRSSTVGPLANIPDEPAPRRPSPDASPSANRAVAPFASRKSFGDIFHLPHRLRQNSEVSRSGGEVSPAFGSPGTPGSMGSKPNSFSMVREPPPIPKREEGDTPGSYLERLEVSVPRRYIGTALSQSADEFFRIGLRKYMRQFALYDDPLDMALRKFLMEADLPKETQQIDRVLQAFADRYHECNPHIFSSADQAYFFAFSLLILHTDVFNRNNKRKMQKPDYVRNARDDAMAAEILECFYDNICYTPFIHLEEEERPNNRPQPKHLKSILRTSSTDHLALPSRDPVDPYALILDNKLGALRPNLKDVMILDDIYNTGEKQDTNSIHRCFHRSSILQIVSARSRPDAFRDPSSIDNPDESHPGLVAIRVAKVGLLWRKDPRKKRARSPWAEWGVILTGSQLYFFRDVQWVKTLMGQHEEQQKTRRVGVTFKPPLTDFRPDATMSTDEAVALVDTTYKRHKNAFLLVRHGGLEEVFLADNESELHSWLATINYAAAFRTTGVHMRGMIGARFEDLKGIERSGSTASDVSALMPRSDSGGNVKSKKTPNAAFLDQVSLARRQLITAKVKEADEKLAISDKKLENLLRNATHVQILTPIHPRAREQVVVAAGRMAARVKWARLDIWRTKCHRDVLVADLAAEEKTLGDKQARLFDPGRSLFSAADPSATTLAASAAGPQHKSSSSSLQQPRRSSELTSPEPPRPASADSAQSPTRRLSFEASVTSQESRPRPSHSRDGVSAHSKESFHEGGDYGGDAGEPTTPPKRSRNTRLSGVSSTGPDDYATPPQTPQTLQRDNSGKKHASEGDALPLHEARDWDTRVGKESKEAKDGKESKVRRSLHRTIREASHIPHHHHHRSKSKNKKAKDAGDDGSVSETETLTRSAPSFTVHGKKASVVTFGSEWQDMPSEQKLKMRKPSVTPGRVPASATNVDDGDDDGNDGDGAVEDEDSHTLSITGSKSSAHSPSVATSRSHSVHDGASARGAGTPTPADGSRSWFDSENWSIGEGDQTPRPLSLPTAEDGNGTETGTQQQQLTTTVGADMADGGPTVNANQNLPPVSPPVS